MPGYPRRNLRAYGQRGQHGIQFSQGMTGNQHIELFRPCLFEPLESGGMQRVRFYNRSHKDRGIKKDFHDLPSEDTFLKRSSR